MAQVNPDLWGLGEIPTVTSFFKLSLLDGKPKAGYTQLSSEKCGLGWVYLFQATNLNVTQRLASGAEIAKRTIFHVSLATHTIATTEIGEITVSVKADNVTELTHYSSSILIPNSRPVPLASIISLSNFTGDISIQVQVELPSTFELAGSLGDKRSGTTLNIALAHSLLGKDLGDLRLACFNRRDGTVGGKEPKILFVNRSLLVGHSEYFDAVLSGAHPSCEIISPGSLKSLLYNDYEYFCDSDLESECDPDDCEGDATETQSKNSFPCQRDSILDDHEDIIFYGNAAYTTLKAFAFYLYTNEIRFKCLSSCKVSQHNAETGITSCSPKSMYRFAAQAGLEQLKELSLRAIIADISKDNVIEELFSPFTSMSVLLLFKT
ncbi:hypothetical protein H0H93_002231 [Arthromyces matolae]|nr:hypothetical protein H0H93_002231 [Arthromyces matolae]